MDKKDINMPKIITYTLLLFSVVLIMMFFRDSVVDLFMKTVLYGVQTYMPRQGVTFKEREIAVDTTAKDVYIPALKPTEATETTEKAVGDFYATPDDVTKLIAEAEKRADKDKKGGTIIERQYINDGVTDSFGKVRVKNVNETSIDIEALLSEKIELGVDREKPAVLIFHTHTTETYQLLDRNFYAKGFASRTNDSGKNMVRVGKEIAQEIESMGFKVIHDTEIHDSKYNGSYERSRKKCLEYLEKYPSIKVVLDVHRDAISPSSTSKIKPVCTLEGKKSAQVMIISGCEEKGNGVTDFPNWRKNLVFAVHLQNKLEGLFEGITRPLYFSPRKYNMDLTTCSLLLEMGSEGNTLGEAVLAGKCVGRAVGEILKEYEI